MTSAVNDPVRARIIQCVNACSGMIDPSKEIQAMREERVELQRDVSALLGALPHGAHDVTEGVVAIRAMRQQLEWLWSNCKIIYWPKRQGVYPIEHAPAANKDGRWLIEAEMAGEPIGVTKSQPFIKP